MTVLHAEMALLPEGWAHRVRITLDAAGDIAALEAGAASDDAERLAGPVLPGMPNLHSHAFQRAMAGLAEHASESGDDFWSWRDTMYRFLAVLEPDDLRAIAAQLYVEMLKAGFTAVGEFHYVHHGRDGRPYGDRAAMSEAVLDAAAESGIGITLLPVLFQANGFGGVEPTDGQRRFLNGVDDILGMIEELNRRHGGNRQIRIGLAPHSLRAVPPDSLASAVAGLRAIDLTAPVHMHVAEQVREVDQCVAWSGRRPVDWLLDHADVDETWCLVHATHIDAVEIARLAESRAVVGLCPTTEANLGDGLFPLLPFLKRRGRWGIGSDSHVSVSPIEELRWLEYGQRLHQRRRALATAGLPGSTGLALWQAASDGGGQALGRRIGKLAPGYRADLVVLDPGATGLYGRRTDTLLDSLVFAGDPSGVRDVMVGGQWVVRDRQHPLQERILARYRRTLDRIGPEIGF